MTATEENLAATVENISRECNYSHLASDDIHFFDIKAIQGRFRLDYRQQKPTIERAHELINAYAGSTILVCEDAHFLGKALDGGADQDAGSPLGLTLHIPSGKAGLKQFTQVLPKAIGYAFPHLGSPDSDHFLRVAGTDLGTVSALMMGILYQSFDDLGGLRATGTEWQPSKSSLRLRLQWIQQSAPHANPSRALMNRVNEHFMSN